MCTNFMTIIAHILYIRFTLNILDAVIFLQQKLMPLQTINSGRWEMSEEFDVKTSFSALTFCPS